MMGNQKKIHWLLLSVFAMFVSVGLQIILGAVPVIPAAIKIGMEAGRDGITDLVYMKEMLRERVLEAAQFGIFLYHVFAIPIFGLWYYYSFGKPKMTDALKKIKLRVIPGALIASFGFYLLADAIVISIYCFLPRLYGEYVTMLDESGFLQNPVMILAAVVFAPIGEEILCRGIILNYGKRFFADIPNKKVAFWFANLLQAMFFGIMHGNAVQGFYAFVIGLGLGTLCQNSGSLIPAMICHTGINFLSSFLVEHILWWVPVNVLGIFLMLLLGSLITYLAAFIFGGKQKQASL